VIRLENLNRARVQEAERRAQQLRARSQAQDSVAGSKFFLGVHRLLRELQASVSERALTSITTEAAKFTRGILRGELMVKDGDVGYIHPELNRWVSHETFSGTEQMVAYAGWGYALNRQAPLKIILLDEMGTVDPETRALVVERLVSLLTRGEIDQVIVADWSDESYRDSSAIKCIYL
ncbi:MAG: hypothetical protein L0191_16190, partial [Acidobacteria bacterium]|nr:hypothetical protein [Acidobacteriota bacterium]